MKPIERIVFLLLLILFPIQLGKHFWPEFAFVHGIRVDYLSPTLYLTDILVFLLFLVSFVRLRSKLLRLIGSRLFLLFIASLFISFLFSEYKENSLFATIKLIEFVWVGFYCSQLRREDFKNVVFVLVLGSLVQISIMVLQFASQQSIGGVFYYLGERTFNATTPGIALARIGEQLVLRPYGAFPHPNVLAFYLLIVFIIALYFLQAKNFLFRIIKAIVLLTISLGICLTFSRVIIFLMFLIIGIHFWKDRRLFLMSSMLSLVALFLLSTRIFQSFGNDLVLRFELMVIGVIVFIKTPIVGVGLNNFFHYEILYQKTITPMLLQPIHNVYVLWIVSMGILGGVPAYLFINKLLTLAREQVSFILVLCLLVIGMFDHYLITLQQGQLLAAFTIGVIFSGLLKAKE